MEIRPVSLDSNISSSVPTPAPNVLDVLAIDPGNHTGVAYRTSNGKWAALMIYESPPRIFEFLKKKPMVLVIETFHTAGRISKDGLYTVRLIGGIEAIAYENGVPIVEHEPYIRMSYLQQAKELLLEQRGRRIGFTDHEMDALAHLLAYEDRRNYDTRDRAPRHDHPDTARTDTNIFAPRTPGTGTNGRSSVSTRGKGPITTPAAIRARLADDEAMHSSD